MATGDHVIAYTYDKMGRLTAVESEDGTTKYKYDANGNRISTEYPNGVTTTYKYNKVNALISQISKDNKGTVISSFEYEIGSNGERLSCKELGRTVKYSYDKLNRLTSEEVTSGDKTSVTTYKYDSNSNRISKDADGVVTNYTYNELNQLITEGDKKYTYSDAGNLITVSENSILISSYEYDSLNRMVKAEVNNGLRSLKEEYTYDYSGVRTS